MKAFILDRYAAVFSADRGIALREWTEQPRLQRIAQADSGIGYDELDMIDAVDLTASHVQRDASVVGELSGVAEQIEEDLTSFQEVSANFASRWLNSDAQRIAILPHDRGHRTDEIVHHVFHGERLEMQVHLPGFEFGHVENAVDEPQQMLARTLNFGKIGGIRRPTVRLRVLLQHFAV